MAKKNHCSFIPPFDFACLSDASVELLMDELLKDNNPKSLDNMTKALEMLCETLDSNMQNITSLTIPQVQTLYNDNREAATKFLEKAYAILSSWNESLTIRRGDQIAHLCSRVKRCPDVVFRLALHTYPESLQKPNEKGELPLHCAILGERSLSDVILLLKLNPSAAAASDNLGRVPLHLLASHYEGSGIEHLNVIYQFLLTCPTLERFVQVNSKFENVNHDIKPDNEKEFDTGHPNKSITEDSLDMEILSTIDCREFDNKLSFYRSKVFEVVAPCVTDDENSNFSHESVQSTVDENVDSSGALFTSHHTMATMSSYTTTKISTTEPSPLRKRKGSPSGSFFRKVCNAWLEGEACDEGTYELSTASNLIDIHTTTKPSPLGSKRKGSPNVRFHRSTSEIFDNTWPEDDISDSDKDILSFIDCRAFDAKLKKKKENGV